MPAWIIALSGLGVFWVAYVVAFHPFRKGTHAAPRGLTPDVRDLTVPVASTEHRPPWDAPDPFEGYPDWARPEAARWAVGGANSGANGYSLPNGPSPAGQLDGLADWTAPRPVDPRLLAETWLEAQIEDLFTWVRACHAG